ncbi:hypothetical protein T4B_10857 [Trichinella pseudospiralis]|uniref:MULE transposase domain-containing protein n=1 Tax=Trichinella pseudospiralis TaxID=6337 RepID=A0A0V1J7I2_TRIPS|nr:hypothetical protein T4B_10857 [Trichinella pseudospiralis]
MITSKAAGSLRRVRTAIHIWLFSHFYTRKVHDLQPTGKVIPETAQPSSEPANLCPVQDNEGRLAMAINCWQPCEPRTWMVFSRLYNNGINSYLLSMSLWRVSWCQQSAVYVLDIKKLIGFVLQSLINEAAVVAVSHSPQTICGFETTPIAAIRGSFLNTRVQRCYFHFCQAVHRNVGELGLKIRCRTKEETNRKIRKNAPVYRFPVGTAR